MIDNQQNSATPASNDAPMPPQTSAPWQTPAPESDQTTDRPKATKGTYVETPWALVDKHLLSGAPSGIWRSVVVILWFLVIVWLLSWAHYKGELISLADWLLFGLKIGVITVTTLIAGFFLPKKDS